MELNLYTVNLGRQECARTLQRIVLLKLKRHKSVDKCRLLRDGYGIEKVRV
jgi:hypothetical protein